MRPQVQLSGPIVANPWAVKTMKACRKDAKLLNCKNRNVDQSDAHYDNVRR